MKKTEELTKFTQHNNVFPARWNTSSVHGSDTYDRNGLRTVVINQDDEETILSQKPKRLSKAKAMEASINEHQEQSELWTDIEAYKGGA